MKQPCVYIMTNCNQTVLYTGVTSDLPKRVWQHKNGAGCGFTSRYHCTRLVWYECCDSMYVAITREKQIKGGSRQKKLDLVTGMNPQWLDLYGSLG